MKPNRARVRVALALLTCALVPGVAEAQTRVKSGFNMFSPSQDVEIGRQSAAQVEQQMPLVNSSTVQSYVNTLGRKLAAHAPGERFPYQFKVVNASDLNAFALPGGPIYLNRGVLEAARNEGEVAGVLAHEIAHVALRHGTHNASKAYLTQAGLGILGGVLGGKVGANTAQVIQAVGGFGLNALFLKYSRDAETQADILGAQILARAGYNPADMSGFFETLARQDKRKTANFLSSHPTPTRRIERINQEARLLGVGNAPTTRTAELNRVKSTLRGMPAARTSQQAAALRESPPQSSRSRSVQTGNVEAPASTFSRYTSRSRLYQFSHPSNWRVVDEGPNSVLLAPPGGTGTANGSSEVVHGVIVNHYDPFGNTDAGRGTPIDRATDDLLSQLMQTSSHLRLVQNSRRALRTADGTVLTAVLAGNNPNTRLAERVTVATRQLDDDHLIYMLVVTPERDAARYAQVVSSMISSLRVDAGHRH